MNNLEYRMYGIVPYNISEIQKGIQFGHAVVEYSLKHFKNEDFQEWAKKHKTFMVMNGGTTNNGEEPHKHVVRDEQYVGSIQKMELELKKNKIKYASFFEPDLNDTLTAVVFLADERTFNKVKYPDPTDIRFGKIGDVPVDARFMKEWEKQIGGKHNLFLREFISKLRFA